MDCKLNYIDFYRSLFENEGMVKKHGSVKKVNGRTSHYIKLILLALIFIIILAVFSLFNKSRTDNIHESSESGLVAIVQGHVPHRDGGVEGGDLWILDPNTLIKTRITTNGKIGYVHDWSPDSKHIAVVLQEKTDNITSSIAIINTSTGEINRLKEVRSGVRGKILWNSTDSVLYLRSDKPNTVSKIVTSDKSEQDFIVFPEGFVQLDLFFNDDFTWVASGNKFLGSGKIFSFDSKNKKMYEVTNKPALLGGWRGNKLIYADFGSEDNTIWEVNADGSQKVNLIELDNKQIKQLIISPSEDSLDFAISEISNGKEQFEYYSYDFESKNISKIEVNRVRELSKDQKYTILRNSRGLELVNLHSMEVNELCNSIYCDARWSY